MSDKIAPNAASPIKAPITVANSPSLERELLLPAETGAASNDTANVALRISFIGAVIARFIWFPFWRASEDAWKMKQTWAHHWKTGNITLLISPNNGFDIELRPLKAHGSSMMKQIFLALALIAYALPSQAACYADYKAKQDNPLKLHYGVMELPDAACSNRAAATRQVTQRLNDGGWLLLKIQSIFDETGLTERKESAGEFFLRF